MDQAPEPLDQTGRSRLTLRPASVAIGSRFLPLELGSGRRHTSPSLPPILDVA